MKMEMKLVFVNTFMNFPIGDSVLLSTLVPFGPDQWQKRLLLKLQFVTYIRIVH